VLIVDDESLARDTLRLLLDEHDDFEVVGECADGETAVRTIRELEPDLVFLDVQMPGLTGLEVVEEIGAANMPTVVFATAFDEYAVKAFEASAIDYLVKPFSDERFEAALDRLRATFRSKAFEDLGSRLQSLLQSQTPTKQSERSATRFLVKERDAIRFVEAENIEWVEAAGDYVVLHAADKQHMIRETMSGMERKLDGAKFLRIHRSTIVNVAYIRELKPYFHGDYIVYLQDGTELKLSRRYWGKVEKALSA
jgi:two-component system LytT family response regulator